MPKILVLHWLTQQFCRHGWQLSKNIEKRVNVMLSCLNEGLVKEVANVGNSKQTMNPNYFQ